MKWKRRKKFRLRSVSCDSSLRFLPYPHRKLCRGGGNEYDAAVFVADAVVVDGAVVADAAFGNNADGGVEM